MIILTYATGKLAMKERRIDLMGIYKTDVVELRKYMAEKEMNTITKLSEESGINRNTLCSVLSGVSQPSSVTMERLVKALEIPPEKAGEIFFSQNLREK